LPEIAKPEDHDRISAKGFSFGYIGGAVMQIIGFGLVLYFSANGDHTSGPLFTFLFVGLWWIGFAQITFFNLPNILTPVKSDTNFLTSGFIELKKVWVQIRSLIVLKWFLVAFLFYSMGVQTVMLAATLFGQQALGLPADKLILTILLMQIVAVVGATMISRLSKRFGNIAVLMVVVSLWIAICIAAYLIATMKEDGYEVDLYFYMLAAGVGLIMGGIQALSRSTYSKLMPPTRDTASFFSFYDVTEKISIVIGIFTFGYIDEIFGMKNSVLMLIVFFVLGFGALFIAKGKEANTNLNHHP
jgi:UMF1 family MFS transporter